MGGVALAVAGCGPDEFVPGGGHPDGEAGPDGSAPGPDAAPPDAVAPDASGPPSLVVGPVTTMAAAPGDVLYRQQIGDIAWSGTDFVITSEGMSFEQRIWRVSAEGEFLASDIVGQRWWEGGSDLACQGDGSCVVVWSDLFGAQLSWSAIAPSAATMYHPRSYGFASVAPLIGAFAGGYVVVAPQPSTGALSYFRTDAIGNAIESATVVPDGVASTMTNATAIGCNADGCTLAYQTISGQVAVLRVAADPLVAPIGPTVLPDFWMVNAVACTTDRCLVTEQSDEWSGAYGQLIALDGTLIGTRFSIASFAGGTLQHELAADATGFVLLTSASGAAGATEQQAVRIGFDGSVGAVFSVMPSGASPASPPYTYWYNPDALGCSPTRCLAVRSGIPDGRVARIEGSTVLDMPGLLLVGANEHTDAAVGSDGTQLLVAWDDARLDGAGAMPEAAVHVARWSPVAGWLAPLGDALTPVSHRWPSVAWNGASFVVGGEHLDLVSPSGAVAAIGSDHHVPVACHARCLMLQDTYHGHVIEQDGTPVAGSELTLTHQSKGAAPFDFAFGEGFASVGYHSNGRVVLTPISIDGAVHPDLEIAPPDPLQPPATVARVGDRLVVFWSAGGSVRARWVAADLSLGPVVELPAVQPTFDGIVAATVGDGALLVWYQLSDLAFHALRVDGDVTTLDAPFALTPRTVIPYPRFSQRNLTMTDGLGAFAWDSLDDLETTGVRRLRFVPLRWGP
jgi:hypothetical protein